jgi:hypothetical protein
MDIATGDGHGSPELGFDGGVDPLQVGGYERRGHQDRAVRWRGVDDRSTQATERDGVRIEAARGKQGRGGEEQETRRQHDRPVGPASMDDGTPQPKRSDDA